MKSFIVLLAFFFAQSAVAVHVVSPEAGIDITTDKVTHIDGMIGPGSPFNYALEQSKTFNMPGDRVILINSGGGYTTFGEMMLSMMQAEQAQGIKMICVGLHSTSSMAFNFMSFCDVRLMIKDDVVLVHKLEIEASPGERQTAKRHREMAAICEELDEPYRQRNSHAMHLSLKEYDKYADKETYWKPSKLVKMKYLQGIATVTDDK